MKESIKKCLAIIEEKERQKQRLEYEIDLIKNDCVKRYQTERRYSEICDFTDFHGAWIEQPKKIAHKIYKPKYLKTKYHRFMYWVQDRIFESIIDEVEFYGPLMITGWSTVCINVPFKYKGLDFDLRIPNIPVIDKFDDMMSYGWYSLRRRVNSHFFEEFARFDSCDELKENIKDALDKRVEVEKGDKNE